jgi:hypothetical protein
MIVKFVHVSGHPLFYSKVSSQASVADQTGRKKKLLSRLQRERKERERDTWLTSFSLSFFLEIELEGVWIGLLATSTSKTSSNRQRPTIWRNAFLADDLPTSRKEGDIYPCRERERDNQIIIIHPK